MAPVVVGVAELEEEYCQGTTDELTSGRFASVAGARVRLVGLLQALTCDDAPGM